MVDLGKNQYVHVRFSDLTSVIQNMRVLSAKCSKHSEDDYLLDGDPYV